MSPAGGNVDAAATAPTAILLPSAAASGVPCELSCPGCSRLAASAVTADARGAGAALSPPGSLVPFCYTLPAQHCTKYKTLTVPRGSHQQTAPVLACPLHHQTSGCMTPSLAFGAQRPFPTMIHRRRQLLCSRLALQLPLLRRCCAPHAWKRSRRITGRKRSNWKRLRSDVTACGAPAA